MIIEILNISNDGAGVGRTSEGKVVFVPYTAVGDVAEVRAVKENKSVIFAELDEVITPSPDRTAPDCPQFGKCGGCDFRHITYEAELKAKSAYVKDTFTRIGKFSAKTSFLPIIKSNTYHYRNKVTFPTDGKVYGFYAPKTHDIVGCRECKLFPEEFTEIADTIIKESTPNKIVIRRGYHSGEVQTSLSNNTITDSICGIQLRISSKSFYQVNTPVAEKLYQTVKEFAQPNGETVLDLYCGIGSIGLFLAKEAKKAVGVESNKAAVADAVYNADLNGITNAEFLCTDASEIPDGISPDVIVTDPARQGCDGKVLKKIVSLRPKRIVMVSCNPATAARDCRELCENGYRAEKAAVFDMFPRTRHAECAVLLSRA